ncbi:hypothetical protein [Pseudomonas viridiflava]|nr:hypothetical protein [Pseudomonas viridiflava]MDY0934614.1 hypothetical protein [Pseudomonas viridiflava]MDY1011253.1 hypothetical protein [Pseudomonas viridiflava]
MEKAQSIDERQWIVSFYEDAKTFDWQMIMIIIASAGRETGWIT